MRFISLFFLLFILTIKTHNCLAFSKSADQMYSDLINSENENNPSDYIVQSNTLEEKTYSVPKQESRIIAVEEFSEENPININRLPEPYEQKSWNDVVKSIAKGNPTAFDIDFIKKETEKNNPKAIELLAWMYAKGVGVPINLKSSWFLYMKAAAQNIENSKENAEKIYNSMSYIERKELLDF